MNGYQAIPVIINNRVIPAKAGIRKSQNHVVAEMPACAGMT